MRPHVLGIDDGPFDKRTGGNVPVAGVMMEGHDLVEAVALTEFPMDGDRAAEFLADWISGLRFASALHGVVLGGITIAGLGVVDVRVLASRLGIPAIIVNRQRPENGPLTEALTAAGLNDRIPLLEASAPSWELEAGLFATHAGGTREQVTEILHSTRHKSQLPEPLRLAHMIGSAVVNGQSRGRP